jgi:predicted ATPase
VELLERETHFAMLDTWLEEVRRSGRGQMVLLGGEAGAGKTALVRAFGERHRSAAVLVGGCEALFTPRPLGPLVDIAAEVGGELAELTDRGASAGEVLVALGRALRGVSVVVVEDLHWADEATLDVVHLLGRRVASIPALVVATYRDDELGRDHPFRVVLGQLGAAHRVTVGPLSPGAVARLAAAQGIDGAVLHSRTGGNPFFVTEVLARGGVSMPGSVRDAVLARAARTPAAARRLLEAVAVARPRAEIWLLERIAADDLSELEACLGSGMLRAEADAVGFRHEIARAAIEDELPPDRRVGLHRAALAALAGRAEPARLATTPRPPTTASLCSSTPRRRGSGRHGSVRIVRPPPTSPPRCSARVTSSRRGERRCSNGGPRSAS